MHWRHAQHHHRHHEGQLLHWVHRPCRLQQPWYSSWIGEELSTWLLGSGRSAPASSTSIWPTPTQCRQGDSGHPLPGGWYLPPDPRRHAPLALSMRHPKWDQGRRRAPIGSVSSPGLTPLLDFPPGEGRPPGGGPSPASRARSSTPASWARGILNAAVLTVPRALAPASVLFQPNLLGSLGCFNTASLRTCRAASRVVWGEEISPPSVRDHVRTPTSLISYRRPDSTSLPHE